MYTFSVRSVLSSEAFLTINATMKCRMPTKDRLVSPLGLQREMTYQVLAHEEGFSIVETGLVMPKDCFFTIEVGDIFKVYLQKSIANGYALTCNGMQRLEKTDEEKYEMER